MIHVLTVVREPHLPRAETNPLRTMRTESPKKVNLSAQYSDAAMDMLEPNKQKNWRSVEMVDSSIKPWSVFDYVSLV